jgi:hypothetical protein
MCDIPDFDDGDSQPLAACDCPSRRRLQPVGLGDDVALNLAGASDDYAEQRGADEFFIPYSVATP